MSKETSTENLGLKVSLFFINGEERHGRLLEFEPDMTRLAMQVDVQDIRYYDARKIAYISFYRHEGTEDAPDLEGLQEKIVNTVTGSRFQTFFKEQKGDRLGFYAFEKSKASEFSHHFFYHQGVRNIEKVEPIGQVLLDSQVVSQGDIKNALNSQERLRDQRLGEVLVEQKKVDQETIDELAVKHSKKRLKIGELLVESELIDKDDLDLALIEQKKNRSKKIGEILVEMGLVTEVELIASLAKKFNLEFVDLDDYVIDHHLIDLFDMNLLLSNEMVPVASTEDTLTVASSDPMNFDAFDNLRFQSSKHIIEVLATSQQIQNILLQRVNDVDPDTQDADWLWVEQISDDSESGGEDEAVELKAAVAKPIVRLVNKVILNGFTKGASDIHILPQAKAVQILYRVNGDLLEDIELEKWVQRRMISRIKLLSGMDITDHRQTQDGRIQVRHEDGIVELRVSCIPNAFGESIVMRVLNKEMATDLESMGLAERDRKALSRMVRKPFGLILATGPTGSGKSTTLYALIQSILELPLHIISIEDPVESEIKGVNQIQVNNKAGLTFASVLRNVLRHDPDVIMVGEMRDKETTSIGVEAALTGHLMLSTLHTNSAVDTVIRLQDLGVPSYLLAPALRGVISQNLLKQLCVECRKPFEDSRDEVYEILEAMGLKRPNKLYMKGGCDSCNQTGFSGRVMVYEFLEVTEAVREAIHLGKSGGDLQSVAVKAGMVPKAQHALKLAEAGIISKDDLMFMLV